MMQHHDQPDPDFACLLRLAFGQPVNAIPIPVPAGYGARGMAFRLEGSGVGAGSIPSAVLLLRYPPHMYNRALRVFTVLRALHSQDFNVPKPLALNWAQRKRWLGLLVEYAGGRSLGNNPFAFYMRVGPSFAETLAQLHGLRWPALPDLPVRMLRYTFDDLARQVRALRTPELNVILDWLLPLVSRIEEETRIVVHGDYRLEHVLARGTQIATVYGWEDTVLADPRFDVGFTSASLSVYGITLSNQFIEAYTAEAGPVNELVIWETFSALRILTRVAKTLSTLEAAQRARFLRRIIPLWQGVLAFVEARTGLPVLEL